MNFELSNTELKTVRNVYELRLSQLVENLVNGISWDEMKELIENLRELSVITYEEVQSSGKFQQAR